MRVTSPAPKGRWGTPPALGCFPFEDPHELEEPWLPPIRRGAARLPLELGPEPQGTCHAWAWGDWTPEHKARKARTR
jgi:hypothetical protein